MHQNKQENKKNKNILSYCHMNENVDVVCNPCVAYILVFGHSTYVYMKYNQHFCGRLLAVLLPQIGSDFRN